MHAQISCSRLNLIFKQVVIISSKFLDLGRHESFLLLNILNKAVTPQYITVPVPQIYSFISLSCVISIKMIRNHHLINFCKTVSCSEALLGI